MAALSLVVFVVALIIHLPARTHYIVNWDGVQFALATGGFDIEQHRPHPPGYVGYVLAGRMLNTFTGDPNTSFVVLSMVAGAAAPALFLPLADRLLQRRRALVVTALFAASPLLWYYSGVALTYAVETALAVGFALVAWKARHEQGRWLIAAAVMLALAGAVRQTTAALLLPLWLWSIWPATTAMRIRAVAALGLASAVWLVPLLWIAGGPMAYIHESIALARLSGTSSSIVSGTPEGVARNWGFVVVSLTAGVGASLLLAAPGLRRGRALFQPFSRDERNFLLAWIVPGIAVFLMGHMGQAGYVLMITPALFLVLGKLDVPSLEPLHHRRAALPALVLACNAAVVLWLPSVVVEKLPPETRLANHVRQYAPEEHDGHWRALFDFIEHYDPDTTAILTVPGGPRSSGSFRQLSYYLPEYRVYALGHVERAYGHVFTAHEGVDNYQISDPHVNPVLVLPPHVDRIIIPDWEVTELVAFRFDVTQHKLPTGAVVSTARVPAGASIAFRENALGKIEAQAIPRPSLAAPWPGLSPSQ